jgi:hypothetical protein
MQALSPIPEVVPASGNSRERGAADRAYRIIAPEPRGFSTHHISALKHDYHEHPMLQLPALARLAVDLVPHGLARFIRPGTTQTSAFDHGPQSPDGRTVGQVFEQIETPGSWVALYNIATIPAYRDLLQDIMAAARPLYETQQHNVFNVDGFVFISAPPSVTPFHIDRENNFWLQLRGRKLMSVWDCGDREVVAGDVVERFIVQRNLDKVRLRDEHRSRSSEFDTGPGDGVYFPSTSPHMTRTENSWVRPGDGVSISIGVVFYSDETRRAARVHCANEFLRRRLGGNPSYPGSLPWLDELKLPLGSLIVRRRRAKGITPVPGLD